MAFITLPPIAYAVLLVAAFTIQNSPTPSLFEEEE